MVIWLGDSNEDVGKFFLEDNKWKTEDFYVYVQIVL